MGFDPRVLQSSISAALLCVSSSSSRLLAHAAALGSTLFALTVRAATACLVGAAKEPDSSGVEVRRRKVSGVIMCNLFTFLRAWVLRLCCLPQGTEGSRTSKRQTGTLVNGIAICNTMIVSVGLYPHDRPRPSGITTLHFGQG